MHRYTQIWVIALCAALLSGCSKGANSKWSPPANPNPDKILEEAEADNANGDYPTALAKHVWYFENALKYDAAQAGVRLSFALSDWIALGRAYPPAMKKLEALRDKAGEEVLSEKNNESYQAFSDFTAINKELEESSKTTDLFILIDKTQPDKAKRLFKLAENALIESKEYKLCSKYIDSDQSYQTILKGYRMLTEQATDPRMGKDLQKFADQKLSYDSTSLISLLVVNGRQGEAQNIIDRLSKEPNIPDFKAQIDLAFKGEVPKPWP